MKSCIESGTDYCDLAGESQWIRKMIDLYHNKAKSNKNAGIDLSPAVRDYLGITGSDNSCDWRFAEVSEIPYGPWRKFGKDNPFASMPRYVDKTKKNEIEILKRAREAWLRRSQR